MKKFDETIQINIEDILINKDDKDKEVCNPKEKTSSKQEKKLELEDIVKNDHQGKTIVEMKQIDPNRIGIASDHRGYKMKQKLTKYLIKKGYTVIDYGGEGIKNDNYTEYGFKLGKAIKNHEIEKGIAICGSGIGISIACNKVQKVRCAKVVNPKEAKWARNDNDANAIAISAKVPLYRAKDIIDTFLNTEFSGLERHQKRIDDLNTYKG